MNLKKVKDAEEPISKEVIKETVDRAEAKGSAVLPANRGDYKVTTTHDESASTFHLFSPEGTKCPGVSSSDKDKFVNSVVEYLRFDD